MKTASPHDTIDVQALRVGMFVHLDGGWMSHPFPLSSFRITSSAQLTTIRSLGLGRVRWSPQQSDLDGDADRGETATALPVDAANDDRGDGAGFDADAGDTVPQVPHPAGDAIDVAAIAATRARVESQKLLARQREARQCCERQYAEAARACRQTFDLVGARPEEARGHAEKLSRALLDKMLGAEELCIRVLTESAGDKASLHALNVAIVSLLMGRCFGFDADEMMDVGVGAMLHDVGKIDLPVRLRHRDDSFSPNELRAYREHVAMGVAQAENLNLEGGALYDPVANYKRVRNRFGDWSDNERYKSNSTRTTGPTPKDEETEPLPPDPLLSSDTPAAPNLPGALVPSPANRANPPRE